MMALYYKKQMRPLDADHEYFKLLMKATNDRQCKLEIKKSCARVLNLGIPVKIREDDLVPLIAELSKDLTENPDNHPKLLNLLKKYE